jgi:hypothetical protein
METYSLNPSLISLERFFQLIRTRRMLPGRLMLKEEMEERQNKLAVVGISNLKELIQQLGSKQKMESLSKRNNLPYPYLVLLKREAGSYLALPKPLSDFPGIPFEYTESLKSKGIKTTRDFFQGAQTGPMRVELASKTGIPEARLLELFVLCDLSRITGIGGTAARLFYEAGIRSVHEFAGIQSLQVSKLSEEDLSYCRDYARVIVECELKSKS